MKQQTAERLLPLLEAALRHSNGTHLMEDAMKAFTEGGCTLWVGKKSFAITEFQASPQRRWLNVWLAGGDIEERLSIQPGIEAFARAGGAEGIQFMAKVTKLAGRLTGWADLCPDFKPLWVTFWKDIAP